MLAAVTLETVAVFVHVAAAVAAFGPTFAYAPAASWVRRHQPRTLPALHAGTAWAAGKVVTSAMTVLLVSGLAIALGTGRLGEGWVLVSLVLLVGLFGLYGSAITPRSREAADLVREELAAAGAGEPRLSGDYEVAFRGLVRLHLVAAGLALLALFLMVTRPF